MSRTILLLVGLAVFVFLGTGGLLLLAQEEAPVRSANLALEEEYDLSPRLSKGEKSYYSYSSRLLHYGAEAGVERRETVRGYFMQEVVGFRPGGAPVFRVVRNHTGMHMGLGGQETFTPFEFGEGFTYEVCFEDEFEFFSPDTSTFPNSLPGFMMFENIVQSHTFSVLATRTHGALDKLRTVGATVTTPDSGKGGQVDFPGYMFIKMVRGQSTLTFLGLSQYRGEAAALLSYDTAWSFPSIGKGKGAAHTTGLIWVSLQRGEILKGTLRETTQLAMPGSGGQSVSLSLETEGLLEKISKEDYPVPVD
jgi:hypothetical protein